MKYEVRHIDYWPVVRIAFLLCGVMGFIFGLFYAILLSIIGGILDMVGGGQFGEISALFSGTFGFFMAFFLAFTYAVLGSIMSAVVVWLYNLFVRIVGGITVTLEPKPNHPRKPARPAATPPAPPRPDRQLKSEEPPL
jgi:hypothetical protein